MSFGSLRQVGDITVMLSSRYSAARVVLLLAFGALFTPSGDAWATKALPRGFVYLSEVDATILQDMRYATANNFTGKKVPGYEAGECILAKPVAEALKRVQQSLQSRRFSLKVYDCYRPTRAVNAFAAWGLDPLETKETKRFYPRLDKQAVFSQGYIARRSTHSLGTSVDLTLVDLDKAARSDGHDKQTVYGSCIGPKNARAPDSTMDMGTGFDCFDSLSHTWSDGVGSQQKQWRTILVKAMQRQGFRNYKREWWHFSLPVKRFKKRHDFPIEKRASPIP